MGKREKMGFYLCLITGVVIALSELIGTLTEGNSRLIWLQVTADGLNLALTPLLPAIPVLIIGQSRIAGAISLVPVVINLGVLLSGRLFTVGADGSYTRDPLIWIFMACYLFSMLFLTYRSFVLSLSYQNHNVLSLLFICLFMISSTSIQLRHLQIHFSWFCVTVTVLLYFIYYSDIIHKMDHLTGLLNRNAFEDYVNRHRDQISGVMMIDLDNFKGINDTYGHLTGDQYLLSFAKCLRRAFFRNGYCYRIGGDECCILLSNAPTAAPRNSSPASFGRTAKNFRICPGRWNFPMATRRWKIIFPTPMPWDWQASRCMHPRPPGRKHWQQIRQTDKPPIRKALYSHPECGAF